MRPKLLKAHARIHRCAVVEYMQIVPLKIDNPFAPRISDIRIAYIPLARHDPVKYSGSGWNLMQGQGYLFLEYSQSFPQTVSCDAPANRIQPFGERVHALA